ncbi:MAG TPA: alpha/beta hydrolase-fold protein [Polyangiaceae bacterium]|nr:alpha/beta hydrolase-fold protein [Polyangiaceae bacterium]
MRGSHRGAIGALCVAACAATYGGARDSPPVGLTRAPALGAATDGASGRTAGSIPPVPPPDRLESEPPFGLVDGGIELTPGAVDVRMTLPPEGTVGAWLVAGPVDRARASDPGEGGGFPPRLGGFLTSDPAAPRWRLFATRDGVLDLAADVTIAGDVAYAGGVVRVDRAGRYVLLVGADDAVSLFVDGRRAFSRDSAGPRRDDEDLIPLDLVPGEHTVVFLLRRYGRPWTLRARLLDPDLAPPKTGSWRLPGTSAEDARGLVSVLTRLSLDRGLETTGYRPTLHVRFPDGVPSGVAVSTRAELVRSAAADPVAEPLFEVALDVEVKGSGPLDSTVPLPEIAAESVEDGDWTLRVDAGGHKVDFPFHPRRAVRDAGSRAERAIDAARGAPWLATASLESVEYLRDRLVQFVGKGDGDVTAQLADARELDELSAALEQGRDPYIQLRPDDAHESATAGAGGWRTGAMRRAYKSPVDGRFSEFAVYVPPDFTPKRTYPLIVALHGMNGHPMQMLMWLFGHDDPDHDSNWEDRHPRRDLETLEALVVAPDGHNNSMYRDLGEDDVMRLVDWAVATYPIDPARVTITGPSMGGIGSAACALHHPDRFAAAEPLCGYHSYFVRGDIGGRSLRPWERFAAETRSNVFWAENGQYLPLYIVHGTKDLPEENSGVLIDRYAELKYQVEQEHPDLGHNVWQTTYEDLKGAKWLLGHRRPLHPWAVRFKTPRTRWADDAWVHVRELSSSDVWGEVFARIDEHNTIYAATRGISALGLDRDTVRIDDAAPVTVKADGETLVFQAGEPIELHRNAAAGGTHKTWSPGQATHDGPYKRATVTGPITDVFHEPILFVWGASDPSQARANEEAARAWARVRWGVRVDYPIVSDAEFAARGESLANERALFLVGNASSNAVLRAMEPSMPIRIEGDSIVVGSMRIAPKDGDASRSQLGTMFIQPNPMRPGHYVVVVEGLGPLGTWRSLSLPELLPDYVVYDGDVTPARGSLVLGGATLRAGGYFGQDWSVTP